MKLPLRIRWTVFKLRVSCWLWDIRGLERCPYHGTYAQSLINGFCKKCGEIPKHPPMEPTCIMCGEEAILQRASPNGDKEIWSLCWECDKFIDWSFEHSVYEKAESMGLDMIGIKKVKPFDEWLFEKEKVYPKHESMTCVLTKEKKT